MTHRAMQPTVDGGNILRPLEEYVVTHRIVKSPATAWNVLMCIRGQHSSAGASPSEHVKLFMCQLSHFAKYKVPFFHEPIYATMLGVEVRVNAKAPGAYLLPEQQEIVDDVVYFFDGLTAMDRLSFVRDLVVWDEARDLAESMAQEVLISHDLMLKHARYQKQS